MCSPPRIHQCHVGEVPGIEGATTGAEVAGLVVAAEGILNSSGLRHNHSSDQCLAERCCFYQVDGRGQEVLRLPGRSEFMLLEIRDWRESEKSGKLSLYRLALATAKFLLNFDLRIQRTVAIS